MSKPTDSSLSKAKTKKRRVVSCRFFNTAKGCRNGNECRFLHLLEGEEGGGGARGGGDTSTNAPSSVASRPKSKQRDSHPPPRNKPATTKTSALSSPPLPHNVSLHIANRTEQSPHQHVHHDPHVQRPSNGVGVVGSARRNSFLFRTDGSKRQFKRLRTSAYPTTSTTTTTSTTSTTNITPSNTSSQRLQQTTPPTEPTHLVIPGYFYDPATKKHFKIGGAARKESMPSAPVPPTTNEIVLSDATNRYCQRGRGIHYISTLISNRQRGIWARPLTHALHTKGISSLLWKHPTSLQLTRQPDEVVTNITANESCSEVAVVLGKACLSVFELNLPPKHKREATHVHQQSSMMFEQPISSVSWQPKENKRLVMTTLGGPGTSGSLCYYNSETSDLFFERYRPFKKTNCWCSAWDPNSTSRLSVGLDGAIGVCDASRSFMKIETMGLGRSDVFALAHDATNGCLVAGCRNGNGFLYDRRDRQASGKAQLQTTATSSVCSVLMPHRFDLIIATVNGSITKCDLRYLPRSKSESHSKTKSNNRILTTYTGHVNTKSIIPVTASAITNTLCCCGEDGVVRLWDLSHGGIPYTHHTLSHTDDSGSHSSSSSHRSGGGRGGGGGSIGDGGGSGARVYADGYVDWYNNESADWREGDWNS